MSDASTVWVFSRGAESVQVARLASSDGSWLLLITGPSPEHRVEQCEYLLASVHQQAELERQLIEDGFRLQRFVTAAAA
jgi:hypothetical protein